MPRKLSTESKPIIRISKPEINGNAILMYFTPEATTLLGTRNKEIVFDPDNLTITIATRMTNNSIRISTSRQASQKINGVDPDYLVGTYELKKQNEDVFVLVPQDANQESEESHVHEAHQMGRVG